MNINIPNQVVQRFPQLKPLQTKFQGKTCAELVSSGKLTQNECSQLMDNLLLIKSNQETEQTMINSSVKNLTTLYNTLGRNKHKTNVDSINNIQEKHIKTGLINRIMKYNELQGILKQETNQYNNTIDVQKKYQQMLKTAVKNKGGNININKNDIATQRRIIEINKAKEQYNQNVINILFQYAYVMILCIVFFFLQTTKKIGKKTFISLCLGTNVIFMFYAYYKINALNLRIAASPALNKLEDWAKDLETSIYNEEKRWAAEYNRSNCNCP